MTQKSCSTTSKKTLNETTDRIFFFVKIIYCALFFLSIKENSKLETDVSIETTENTIEQCYTY